MNKKRRPNIVLIMTDQHRRDCLSCMGHDAVRTPNLDSLAQQGVRFTQAYTPSPICGPARGALFTGRFPPGCGAVGNWVALNQNCNILPQMLQDAGYQTALAGKLHFVPPEESFGFEYKQLNDLPGNIYANDGDHSDYVRDLANGSFRDDPHGPIRLFDEDEAQVFGGDLKRFILGSNWAAEPDHMTTWAADKSIAFLKHRDRDRPFFLFSSFFGPHQPYAVPAPWQGRHKPDNVTLPQPQLDAMTGRPIFEATQREMADRIKNELTEADKRECLAAYYDNVEMLDHHIGRIFDQLRKQDDWENTLVIMVSDHGDHVGQYGLFFKGDMYESSVGVPLLIKQPGGAAGAVCDRVVNTLDLYATIAQAAGCDAHAMDDELECQSLRPLLDDPQADWNQGVMSIVGLDPQQNVTMFRRGLWKLIRKACGKDQPALYELYDMREAVPDARDLWQDEAARAQIGDMAMVLDDWWLKQSRRYPKQVIRHDQQGK